MSPIPFEEIIDLILNNKKRKREEDAVFTPKRIKQCDCEECAERRRVDLAIHLSLEEQKRG